MLFPVTAKSELHQQHLEVPKEGACVSYPLTPSQKQVFFAQQAQPQISYTIVVTHRLTRRAELSEVMSVWRQMVASHELLRTGFVLMGAEPRQFVQPMSEIESGLAETEVMARNLAPVVGPSFGAMFQLNRPPLARLEALDAGSGDLLLRIESHEIVADVASLEALCEELRARLEGRWCPRLEFGI